MQSSLVALFALHLWFVADVPPTVTVDIYKETSSWSERYDIAAVLVSEHSAGRWDFSFEGAIKRKIAGKLPITYEEDSEGSAGERGLFQLWRGWATAAGYKHKDLWNPHLNVRIAVYAVRYMKDKHEKCKRKKDNDHTWIAHYKCTNEARDEVYGRCRYSQSKWNRLRVSITAMYTPDHCLKEQRVAQKKREDAFIKRYYEGTELDFVD